MDRLKLNIQDIRDIAAFLVGLQNFLNLARGDGQRRPAHCAGPGIGSAESGDPDHQ